MLKRVKDTDVHAVVADMRAVQASGALPPQLFGADTKALAPEDRDSPSVLLRNYHHHWEQFNFSLRELLCLPLENLFDVAMSTELSYERRLLPKWVETGEQSVKDQYALRQRVGVEAFNSPRGRYLQDSVVLCREVDVQQQHVTGILDLYDHRQELTHPQQQGVMDDEQFRALDVAIAKIKKRLGPGIMQRLRAEEDMEFAELMPGPRRFWVQYDRE